MQARYFITGNSFHSKYHLTFYLLKISSCFSVVHILHYPYLNFHVSLLCPSTVEQCKFKTCKEICSSGWLWEALFHFIVNFSGSSILIFSSMLLSVANMNFYWQETALWGFWILFTTIAVYPPSNCCESRCKRWKYIKQSLKVKCLLECHSCLSIRICCQLT